MLVRPALAADVEAITTVLRRAYVEEGLVDARSPYVAELTDVAGRVRDALLLVVCPESEPALVLGTVTFCLPGTSWAEISRPGEAEFRMLAVDPQARRAGVATTLVTACLDRAQQAGASRLVMSSTQQMTAAHALYRRLGFVRAPDRDWSPRAGIDLWAFQRELAVSPSSAQ